MNDANAVVFHMVIMRLLEKMGFGSSTEF